MAAVILLWITEALPLPVTALGAAAACIVFRVAPAAEVFRSFADPLIFLFIGSFILARALVIHGLDRRLAFGVLSLPWVDARPSRMLLAFGAVTALAKDMVQPGPPTSSQVDGATVDAKPSMIGCKPMAGPACGASGGRATRSNTGYEKIFD